MAKPVDNFKHFDILVATLLILTGSIFLLQEYHHAALQQIWNSGAAIFSSIHGFLKNGWLTFIKF